jgi:hypothetical protein
VDDHGVGLEGELTGPENPASDVREVRQVELQVVLLGA